MNMGPNKYETEGIITKETGKKEVMDRRMENNKCMSEHLPPPPTLRKHASKIFTRCGCMCFAL
jgi:hypothetical protein